MNRAAEIAVFGALALAIHAAAFARLEPRGVQSTGLASAAAIGVAGGEIATLVRTWQSEPSTSRADAPATPESDVEPDFAVDSTPPVRSGDLDRPVDMALRPDPMTAVTASKRPSMAPPPDRPIVTTADAALAVSEPSSPPSRSALRQPSTPRMSNATGLLPRDIEPEPDPTTRQATPAPQEARKSVADTAFRHDSKLASPRREPIVSRLTTPVRPEPVAEALEVPHNGTKAPLSARLPTAKPRRHSPRKATSEPSTARAPTTPMRTSTRRRETTSAAAAPSGRAFPKSVNGGSGTLARTSANSAAAIAAAESTYVAAVRRAVAREKRYPRRAQRGGITGKATIRVTLDRSGRLVGIDLVASSGDGSLDDAALRAGRAARYPAIPPGIARAQLSVTLPMRFERR